VEKIKSYQEKYGKVVRRIVTPAIELSSTDVRAAVAEGFSIEGAVPPAVADYIHTHGLYRNA
jgi:nicotinate-nucleotide adenylyltransferase